MLSSVGSAPRPIAPTRLGADHAQLCHRAKITMDSAALPHRYRSEGLPPVTTLPPRTCRGGRLVRPRPGSGQFVPECVGLVLCPLGSCTQVGAEFVTFVGSLGAEPGLGRSGEPASLDV